MEITDSVVVAVLGIDQELILHDFELLAGREIWHRDGEDTVDHPGGKAVDERHIGVLNIDAGDAIGVAEGYSAIFGNLLEQRGHPLALVLLALLALGEDLRNIRPNIGRVLNRSKRPAINQTVENALGHLDAEARVPVPAKRLESPQCTLVTAGPVLPVIRTLRGLLSD